jgi:hypothetical protein
MKMRPVCHLLIATVTLLAACADVPSESTTREAVITSNRVTANRVTANRVTANRVTANRITADRITGERLNLNGSAAEMLATADGREVLSVLVSCALPEGITLVGHVGDTEFEFPGEIGLARGWLHRALDREDQGWVSACVFSRINVHDVAVPISIRGPQPALRVGRDERRTWSLEEGAFYGNLFTPLDQPILWIACRGAGQAAGESGGLAERDCAEEDPAHPGLTQCGFFYAGDCGEFDSEAACEQFSDHGEFYQRCHSGPIDDGARHDAASEARGYGQVFREVITTYVIP